MLKINEIVRGKVTSYSNEGEGVIHFNKDIIFIKGLLLNEVADIKINYFRNKIYYASIVKIYEFSKDRVASKCPISTACGGCQFHVLDYKKQLEFKTNKVVNAIKFIGKISANVLPCIGLDNPYNYRNKIQMPIGEIKGKVISGFYKNNTHKICPIEECAIDDVRSYKILKSFKRLMESFKIKPYNEDNRSGIIRHLLIRTSYHFNEIMLVIVSNVDSFPSRNNFIHELIKENSEITTIVQNTNKRDTNVILGENEKVLYGKGYIKDTILGIEFSISPKSFFQINPRQTENLYKYIVDLNIFNKDQIVLDAYCGVGTIGMCIAKKVNNVIGVEIIKDAVIDARKNANKNNIKNISFVCDDASKFICSVDSRFDVVLMDPPRKGSSIEFLNSLLEIKPKYIVYVSCDPNTLARDLKELSTIYNIDSIQPFDMFPFTHHCENVALLSLKK